MFLFWPLPTLQPLPADFKVFAAASLQNKLQAEQSFFWVFFTEMCLQSVWEESADSQVIGRHSSLERLYVSLTFSVTTPFIKLNES